MRIMGDEKKKNLCGCIKKVENHKRCMTYDKVINFKEMFIDIFLRINLLKIVSDRLESC